VAARRTVLRSAARPPSPEAPSWTNVLAGLSEGILLVDAAGRVRDMNPAAESLTGVAASQAAGRRIEDLFGGEPMHAWLTELVTTTLSEGLARRRSEGALRTRGATIPVSAACAPTYDDDGQKAGVVLVLHDLGLERTLDETARRADRLAALGTVAQGLAHEIRNPLGGIKGAAQLLRAGLTDPEQIRCTDIIVREVERLDGLVEQLRGLGTPPRLQVGPVNIHRILNDVLALQRQAPEWGDIVLRTEFDPSLPAVAGDAAQLTQVFLNLVKNAVESMRGRGQLLVSTRIEARFHVRRRSGRQQYLSVLVTDDGPGVPERDREQLFSPFFSTKTRGTGLGLAVCHRIASEHGGTIAYEPRAGGGAAFRVTLPVSEDHDHPGA